MIRVAEHEPAKQMNGRGFLRPARAILVGCAFAGLAALVLYPAGRDPCEAAKDPVWSTARVVHLAPRQHQTVTYELVVDGTGYLGTATGSDGGKPFSRLSTGDAVEVSYLRTNPARSVLGNARESCRQDWALFIAGTMFALLASAAMAYVSPVLLQTQIDLRRRWSQHD